MTTAGWGAHAEYRTVRENASLARVPANLSYEQVAPATEGSHYALANITKANIRAGQRVLVNGATRAIRIRGGPTAGRPRGARDRGLRARPTSRWCAGWVSNLVIDRYRRGLHRGTTRPLRRRVDAVGKSSFGRAGRLLTPRGWSTCPPTSARAARTRSWR